jgi:hypothetical protein
VAGVSASCSGKSVRRPPKSQEAGIPVDIAALTQAAVGLLARYLLRLDGRMSLDTTEQSAGQSLLQLVQRAVTATGDNSPLDLFRRDPHDVGYRRGLRNALARSCEACSVAAGTPSTGR